MLKNLKVKRALKKHSTLIIILGIFILSRTSFAYTDFTNEHWAYDAVDNLTNQKIIDGYPDGTFKPNKNIKREEFLKMLIISLGYNPEIKEGYWADKYVDIARNLKIINDEYTSAFLKGEITRYEICQMIFNSFSSLKTQIAETSELSEDEIYQIENIFSDSKNYSQKMQKIIFVLNKAGILNGYNDGKAMLNQPSTRAEMACFINRIYENINQINNFGLKFDDYKLGIKKEKLDVFPIFLMKRITDSDIDTPLEVKVKIKNIEIIKANERENSKYENIFNIVINTESDKYKLENNETIIAIEFEIINNSKEKIVDDDWLQIRTEPYVELKYLFNDVNIEGYKKNMHESGIFINSGETYNGINFFSISQDKLEQIKEIEISDDFTLENLNRQSIIIQMKG